MTTKEIMLPDIGDFQDVDVIEVLVKAGDSVNAEDPLISLESDKASMDIPAPEAGIIKEVKINVGDKISQGTLIALLETADSAAQPSAEEPESIATEPATAPSTPMADSASDANAKPQPADDAQAVEVPPLPTLERRAPPPVRQLDEAAFAKVHASPSVRRFARELGVDLSRIQGSGRKGRINKDDVQRYVKSIVTGTAPASAPPAAGSGIPPIPEVDFSQFGKIEAKPLTRIQKLSGPHLHRAWLNVPMVTQHDEADVTELEAFRKSLKAEAEGVRVTALAFIMKAVAAALQAFPKFSSSLAADGENLIYKHYYHIGIAVDTANGLVVPVLRDVDAKSIYELSGELGEVSQRARDGKLSPKDLQGGCFSISSLGGIGGSGFTPIVNAPEVAILGVSRAQMKPVWNGNEFVPRLMLPLDLSYDHRVIDGAVGARFIIHLSSLLGDVRRLLL